MFTAFLCLTSAKLKFDLQRLRANGGVLMVTAVKMHHLLAFYRLGGCRKVNNENKSSEEENIKAIVYPCQSGVSFTDLSLPLRTRVKQNSERGFTISPLTVCF